MLILLSSAPRSTSEQQLLSPARAQLKALGEALDTCCTFLVDARFCELKSLKLLQFDDLMTISQEDINSYERGFFFVVVVVE